ncbi:MAG: glycoside hydrolase, partial [Actinobacteria bacterium]|nr:glycoside hydrolase [Actinomycetota bacterium]
MTKRWAGGMVLATMAMLLVSPPAGGEGKLRVTKNVQITGDDTDPGRTYTAPNLAVDPANPLTVVAAYGEMRTRRCEMRRSADGGQTWTKLENIPTVAGYPFCFTANFATHQAMVAFGRNSTLYAAMPGWDVQDRLGGSGNVSVLVGRSTDLGDSWDTIIAHNTRSKQDKEVEAARLIPGLVVDSRGGNDDIVYVSWTRQMPNQTAPDAEPLHPMLSVSTDGGRTFAAPVDLTAGVFKNPTIRSEGLKT